MLSSCKKRCYFIIIVFILHLTGCASFYDQTVSIKPDYHPPTKLDKNFTLNGRFFIKANHNSYYGNFNYLRESSNDVMNFTSPLGSTVMRLETSVNNAKLVTEEETYSGADLNLLMQKKLGFIFPLKYLHYWLQGVPLPDYPVDYNNHNGFIQLGWQVSYLSWQDNDHPQLVEFSQGDLRIKLYCNWGEIK